MRIKFQNIIFICFLEKICVFIVIRQREQKLSNRSEIWHKCSFYISSDRVRCPKKSVDYEKRFLRLKIFLNNYVYRKFYNNNCFFNDKK